jgi:hypothetical protein
MIWGLMITLPFILLSLYVLPRLVSTPDLVDRTVFLNAGYLVLRRVDTTTPKLVEVKFRGNCRNPPGH